MPKRSLALAVVVLLSTGVFAACGSTAPSTSASPESGGSLSPSPSPSPSVEGRQHVLDVEVTGTAVLATLTFTLDGKVGEEKAVVLPWGKKVEVPYGSGRHEWRVAMEYDGGDVAAVAMVDGKLVTQTAGGGSPGGANSANLSGSFSD